MCILHILPTCSQGTGNSASERATVSEYRARRHSLTVEPLVARAEIVPRYAASASSRSSGGRLRAVDHDDLVQRLVLRRVRDRELTAIVEEQRHGAAFTGVEGRDRGTERPVKRVIDGGAGTARDTGEVPPPVRDQKEVLPAGRPRAEPL